MANEEKSNAVVLIEKTFKNLTFRHRLFTTMFLLFIGGMAVSGYFIHPGLAGLIITSYLAYFSRANIMTTSGHRYQLESIILNAQADAQKAASPSHQKGAYL